MFSAPQIPEANPLGVHVVRAQQQQRTLADGLQGTEVQVVPPKVYYSVPCVAAVSVVHNAITSMIVHSSTVDFMWSFAMQGLLGGGVMALARPIDSHNTDPWGASSTGPVVMAVQSNWVGPEHPLGGGPKHI